MKTFHRPAPTATAGNGSVAVPAALGKPRRRPPPLVIGVAVGAVAFAVFVFLTPASSRAVSVLAVARSVPAGSRVQADDLKVVSLAAPRGVASMAAAQESTVVGEIAKTDLAAGMLLSPDALGVPARSTALVGVALKPGQYPPGLAVGDRVEVLAVALPAGAASSSAVVTPGSVLAPAAMVESTIPSAADPNSVLVALVVSPGQAVTVAEAAAAGQVVLVVQR